MGFGTSEGSFDMSKEFALKECGWEGAAVYRDEWSFVSVAGFVDGARSDLLACTCFSFEEDGDIGEGDKFECGKDLSHRKGFGDQIAK